MKTFYILILIFIISCKSNTNECELFSHPDPREATIFAPNLISNHLPNRDLCINKQRTEIYFRVQDPAQKLSSIAFIMKKNGVWSSPQLLEFSKNANYQFMEPALSYDDQTLYFVTNMPASKKGKGIDMNIWKATRQEGCFSKIEMLGKNVNTIGDEYFPSPTVDGSLYLTRNEKGEKESRIYKAEFKQNSFQNLEFLPPSINCGTDRFNAFVDPEENYLIISSYGMKDQIGNCDYYIFFRDEQTNQWSEPINMGATINLPNGAGWSAYVDKQKENLFFMYSPREADNDLLQINYNDYLKMAKSYKYSKSNIYWIKTDFIQQLKAKAVYK